MPPVQAHLQKLDNGLLFDSEAGVLLAPPSRLRPDPNQPRKHFNEEELAALKKDIESWKAQGRGIASTGFLQPILGRWEPGATDARGRISKTAVIEIVDGERRWRAIHNKDGTASMDWVPVVLDSLPAREARDAALRSSIHRADLLPIEEAHAFAAKMDDEGWGVRPVSRFYNVAPGYVENRLALLGMKPDVQAMVGKRPDTLSSAKVIDKVKNEAVRKDLIKSVVEDKAPFTEIQERAEPFITRDTPKKQQLPKQPRIDVAAYLSSAANNAREVREALKAVDMPKTFYSSQVEPHLKALEREITEIRKGRR